MIKVYKCELNTSYLVDPEVLTYTGGHVIETSFHSNFRHGGGDDWIIPLPKTLEVKKIDDIPTVNIQSLIKSNEPVFDFNSKLYVHPDCTIPRAKVTQKYTRVLNPLKADICVVPQPSGEYKTELIAIFLNKFKGKIYTIRPYKKWERVNGQFDQREYTVESCVGHPLGSKITDINPLLMNSSIKEVQFYNDHFSTFTQQNWRDFLDSTLIYVGNALTVTTKEKWIGDYLYQTMHNVVAEDTILATLGDKSNEITKEVYQNLMDMLNSCDSTVVGLGLKTLSELDYKKYYNTTVHLLNTVSSAWTRNEMKSNVGVKYMLKFFDLWRYQYENYSDYTNQEDFDLLKEVIELEYHRLVGDLLDRFKRRFKFVKIESSHSFKVSPKLEATKETEDSTSEEESY